MYTTHLAVHSGRSSLFTGHIAAIDYKDRILKVISVNVKTDTLHYPLASYAHRLVLRHLSNGEAKRISRVRNANELMSLISGVSVLCNLARNFKVSVLCNLARNFRVSVLGALRRWYRDPGLGDP